MPNYLITGWKRPVFYGMVEIKARSPKAALKKGLAALEDAPFEDCGDDYGPVLEATVTDTDAQRDEINWLDPQEKMEGAADALLTAAKALFQTVIDAGVVELHSPLEDALAEMQNAIAKAGGWDK